MRFSLGVKKIKSNAACHADHSLSVANISDIQPYSWTAWCALLAVAHPTKEPTYQTVEVKGKKRITQSVLRRLTKSIYTSLKIIIPKKLTIYCCLQLEWQLNSEGRGNTCVLENTGEQSERFSMAVLPIYPRKCSRRRENDEGFSFCFWRQNACRLHLQTIDAHLSYASIRIQNNPSR